MALERIAVQIYNPWQEIAPLGIDRWRRILYVVGSYAGNDTIGYLKTTGCFPSIGQ
jgi:hypothetical protein